MGRFLHRALNGVQRASTGGRRVVTLALALVIVLPAIAGAQSPYYDMSQGLRSAIDAGDADNVILLIGDGMGDSEITIARNYQAGARGRLFMDQLPFTGAYTTFSVEENDPSKPNYVPDSAPTASAWSTGQKTSNGRISTSAKSDQDQTTILELAQRAGFRTGNVSTAEITDATPAAPGSHVASRTCQGPMDMTMCPQDRKSAGGPGSISEQLVDHKIDVVLGGGRARFEQMTDAGGTVVDSARRQGYNYVTNAQGLAGVQTGQPVLGLFSTGNMAQEWGGELAKAFPGSGPQRCVEGQRPGDQPSLATMTRKALDLLQRPAGQKGFWLQVEGASIDKRDHAQDPCGQIGETIAFDEAVRVALEFARTNPRTLVIATADHAHTSQIIDRPTKPTHPGAFSVLITRDDAEMTVNYASAPVGESQSHTGAQVRVVAQGPKAANVVGTLDQTDLFYIMRDALRLG